ncbi:MAG TPA: DNA primase [Bacilli bacterium]|nr:DNA primase [Bacilli bacterium]
MLISEEKINEIRKSVNIVDVISDYIPVEQRGKNYFAICPFHDDHNPSMSISPEKQIYTCFVCGAHGNVFSFIMDYENVSFIEAVKMVANRVGITLDISSYKSKPKNKGIEDLYDIYDIANKYYQNNLYTKDGIKAMEYLRDRGFTDEIIKEFEVGLSTNNKLTKVLKNKGYADSLLVNSGISSSKESATYDTFIDRIMFPLWDMEGKTVAFSGRIYKSSDPSKYINSRESDIFKKGKMIYNYHKAKEEIRRKKAVIVVEGFMDVIALYKVGIMNVVATMGTAVTNDHANMLKRLSGNIILCFDGDSAGNKATISCANELLNVGISPSVIRLEEDLDPDDYIKKHGLDKFNEHLNNAQSLLDFKIDYYKSNTNFNNSDEISKYIKEVIEELNNVNDKIIKELTIKKLNDETGVSIPTIKGMIKNKVIKHEPKIVRSKLDKYGKAEIRLLYYMLRHPEVIKIYENNKCYFPTTEFRYLANEIIYYFNKHKSIVIADFITYLNDKPELIDAINKVDIIDVSDNYSMEEINDYIDLLNNYSVESQIKKLTSEFKNSIDENRKTEIMKEISELKVSE